MGIRNEGQEGALPPPPLAGKKVCFSTFLKGKMYLLMCFLGK